MTRLASRALLRTTLAAAVAAAGLAAIAVLGSSSARAPTATPPVTARPSATPSEVARPSPLSTASPTSDPLRAPVEQPTFAPEGRTGDPALDALIDRLLGSATPALGLEYPDLPAHEQICDPGCIDVPHPARDWASRLSGARRSLYAVFTGEDADAHVMLTVDVGKPVAQVWLFKVAGGRLTEIDIYPPHPNPGPVAAPFYFLAAAYSPSPASQYERFYVLPPPDALPQPPRMHPLSVRTGRSTVDALIATIEAHDAGRLLAAFAEPATTAIRDCATIEPPGQVLDAASWSAQSARQLVGLHSVVDTPAGHQPRSDHLVIAFRQAKPYWWVAAGILERDGRIVGLVTGDWSCWPETMYPPGRYVVPPPEGGLAGVDPARRSGIALIDAILDAAAARDETAMSGLIEYTPIACGDAADSPPHTGPPPCPSGAPAGTPVDVLREIDCAPNMYLRDRAPRALIEWVTPPSALYAVVPADASGSGFLVVVSPRSGAIGLSLGERGVRHVSLGCGPFHPDALMAGGRPSFLLPPP